MDQIKIGKFIAEMRKAQGLTQKDLADKLSLSDKAVSKWECGKGLPDNSIMIILCDILGINVNELLSGERLSSGDYNKKAEENMMSLIQETRENTDNHKRSTTVSLIGELLLILFVIYSILLPGGINSLSYFWENPSIVIILAIILIMLFSTKMTKPFLQALRFFIKIENDVSIQEITKSLQAVKLVISSSFMAGILVMMTSIVSFLHSMDEPSSIGPMLATACLSIFYSVIISLLLTPVSTKLKLTLSSLQN